MLKFVKTLSARNYLFIFFIYNNVYIAHYQQQRWQSVKLFVMYVNTFKCTNKTLVFSVLAQVW